MPQPEKVNFYALNRDGRQELIFKLSGDHHKHGLIINLDASKEGFDRYLASIFLALKERNDVVYALRFQMRKSDYKPQLSSRMLLNKRPVSDFGNVKLVIEYKENNVFYGVGSEKESSIALSEKIVLLIDNFELNKSENIFAFIQLQKNHKRLIFDLLDINIDSIMKTLKFYLKSFQLINIETLIFFLKENRLKDSNVKMLADLIEICVSLENLCVDLQGNQLDQVGVESIIKSANRLLNLRSLELNFSHNHIGRSHLMDQLNLKQGQLDLTCFDDEPKPMIVALPEPLAFLKPLWMSGKVLQKFKLDLRGNDFFRVDSIVTDMELAKKMGFFPSYVDVELFPFNHMIRQFFSSILKFNLSDSNHTFETYLDGITNQVFLNQFYSTFKIQQAKQSCLVCIEFMEWVKHCYADFPGDILKKIVEYVFPFKYIPIDQCISQKQNELPTRVKNFFNNYGGLFLGDNLKKPDVNIPASNQLELKCNGLS